MKFRNIIILIVACCLLAGIATFIASEYPDGLEWVAEKLNFLGNSEGQEAIKSPMTDYAVPLIKHKHLSGIVAGIAGVGITFLAAFIFGKILVKKK